MDLTAKPGEDVCGVSNCTYRVHAHKMCKPCLVNTVKNVIEGTYGTPIAYEIVEIVIDKYETVAKHVDLLLGLEAKANPVIKKEDRQ